MLCHIQLLHYEPNFTSSGGTVTSYPDIDIGEEMLFAVKYVGSKIVCEVDLLLASWHKRFYNKSVFVFFRFNPLEVYSSYNYNRKQRMVSGYQRLVPRASHEHNNLWKRLAILQAYLYNLFSITKASWSIRRASSNDVEESHSFVRGAVIIFPSSYFVAWVEYKTRLNCRAVYEHSSLVQI